MIILLIFDLDEKQIVTGSDGHQYIKQYNTHDRYIYTHLGSCSTCENRYIIAKDSKSIHIPIPKPLKETHNYE